MSSPLALAAVTAVLKDLLDNAMADHSIVEAAGGPVTVSVLAPSRIKTDESEQTQLNLFLYHVTPNQGWRNAGLPSRNGHGERLTNPPLALDLHYLLTAYSKEDFKSEMLLGYAMHVLHEMPVLTREAIRKTFAATSPVGGNLPPVLGALSAADLADQVEQIKLTHQPMSTEEMSKLWTALQASYRPTASYHASVVLIEGRYSTKPSLPVRERRLHIRQFRNPVIESISPQIVLPGGTLTIEGQNLKGELTRVNFGVASGEPLTVSDQRLAVIVPANLLPGVNTMQVVHSLDFGTSAVPHQGIASNVAAFMLAPQIVPPLPITVASGASLTLELRPPVGRTQRVTLVVGERTIQIPARPADDPATTTTLSFPIPPDFPADTVLLRVQVDGAESPLSFNETSGLYDAPKVTIT